MSTVKTKIKTKVKPFDNRLGKKPPKYLTDKVCELLGLFPVSTLTDKTKVSYRTLIKLSNGDMVMQSVIDKVTKNIKTIKY